VLCVGTIQGVPIGIGTEMHSLLNSVKLIDVIGNYKFNIHRLDVLVRSKANEEALAYLQLL
jgi:hypothetical protein